MTNTPNTSVDEDAWLDEILLSLRLDATVTNNQAYLVKQFADAKVYIKAHIQEAVVAARMNLAEQIVNNSIHTTGNPHADAPNGTDTFTIEKMKLWELAQLTNTERKDGE